MRPRRAPVAGDPGLDERDPGLLTPALLTGDAGALRRTYAQMRTDFEAMAAVVPPFFQNLLPLAATALCDAGQLAEAREVLARAVARHPSMRLPAARALEEIEVCVAERDAEKEAARAWFARTAAAPVSPPSRPAPEAAPRSPARQGRCGR